VVPPPCRGPAALALRAVSRPFLARVPDREVAGVRVIRVFPTLFEAIGAKATAVAASPRRRAEARREAAPAHSCTSSGAAVVPWAGRVGRAVAIWGVSLRHQDAVSERFFFFNKGKYIYIFKSRDLIIVPRVLAS
jgi:hypothetical protein